MSKKALRQLVLKTLKEQDTDTKVSLDQQLLEDFCRSLPYQTSQVIAIYLARSYEYNTYLVLERALKDGKTVLIPKTLSQGQMLFTLYDEEDLEETVYGLLEPRHAQAFPKEQIDLILVPGVVYRQDGYRIGFGGGYYDRYLADYEGATVSLAYAFQVADFEPEEHDVAVKEVIYR